MKKPIPADERLYHKQLRGQLKKENEMLEHFRLLGLPAIDVETISEQRPGRAAYYVVELR